MINLSSQGLFKKIVGGFFAIVFVGGFFLASVFQASADSWTDKRTYTITPTSATVAVGSAVQFRVNEYVNGEFTEEVTLKAGNDFYAAFYSDPFYLKKGDLPGSFIGVSPGVATVVYTSLQATVSASVTVTGTPAVTSGKIQITSSKNIYDQLFPRASNCEPQFGGNCTWGLAGYPPTLKVDNSFNPPALLTDVLTWKYPHPNKGNTSGPRIFSLEDPTSPVLYPDVRQNNVVDTFEDAFGDFGPALLTNDIVSSKDGAYQFIVDSQGKTVGWHNGVKRYAGESYATLVGVIDRGYKTFLITDAKTYDVSNIEDRPAPPAGLYGGGFPTLPDGFPRMTDGRKFILSDENYVASIGGRGAHFSWTDTGPATIKIYDLGKSSPVATLDISKDVNIYNAAVKIFQQKRDANTDYIVVVVGPTYIEGNHDFSRQYLPARVFVYKFNFLTKQLIKAVDGVKIKEGRVTGVTGFNLGDQRGMMVFTSLGLNYAPLGSPAGPIFPTSYEYRARAYLYTDLADNKGEDILANSPVITDPNFGLISTNLVVGNSTYIYAGGGFDVYTWKLDLKGATPPGPVGCAVSGQINPHFETGASVGSCAAVATCGTSQCTPSACPISGQINPHFETGASAGSCAAVATCGTSQCTPGAGGGGGGGCDFTLTPTPQTLTVHQGASNAIYSLKASANSDPSCFVTITLPVAKDLAGHTVVSPITSESSIVSPGATTLAIFNLSSPPVGSYELNLRAYARGISTKIIKLLLNVQ